MKVDVTRVLPLSIYASLKGEQVQQQLLLWAAELIQNKGKRKTIMT